VRLARALAVLAGAAVPSPPRRLGRAGAAAGFTLAARSTLPCRVTKALADLARPGVQVNCIHRAMSTPRVSAPRQADMGSAPARAKPRCANGTAGYRHHPLGNAARRLLIAFIRVARALAAGPP